MNSKIQSQLSHTLLNLPGWHTRRKIVVIESDDWGSIRMPSKKVYDQLLKMGYGVDRDPYNKYDALETKSDLEAIFEVLCSVKDKNGRNAVITANTVTANPDFDKIRESGFNKYFYKPFVQSLAESHYHEGTYDVWKEGLNAEIFKPQFHGREHLNIKKWMEALVLNHKAIRDGFDYGLYGMNSKVDSSINFNVMGAFNSGLPNDIENYKLILKEGAGLFKDIFGFYSTSFIPTTYTWHPNIEIGLKESGVKYLQGMVHQRIPLDDGENFSYKKTNFPGYKSKYSGLTYLMRNCYFEPSQNNNYDWVGDCLNRINIAFNLNKPATISMHRVNMIGLIDENNRNENLKLLKQLLSEIVKRWPDVEFMSSDELGDEILSL